MNHHLVKAIDELIEIKLRRHMRTAHVPTDPEEGKKQIQESIADETNVRKIHAALEQFFRAG